MADSQRQYRGRRLDTGKWIEGGYYSLEVFYFYPDGHGEDSSTTDKARVGHFIQPTYNEPASEVHPDTVGQSTGEILAGQVIYDGDTLKSFHFSGEGVDHSLYHDVYWSDRYGSWMTCNQGEKDIPEKDRKGSPPLWVYLRHSKKIEIIATAALTSPDADKKISQKRNPVSGLSLKLYRIGGGKPCPEYNKPECKTCGGSRTIPIPNRASGKPENKTKPCPVCNIHDTKEDGE